MTAEVVSLPTSLASISTQMRALADQIDAGEIDPEQAVVLLQNNGVQIYGWGKCDIDSMLALICRAQNKMSGGSYSRVL